MLLSETCELGGGWPSKHVEEHHHSKVEKGTFSYHFRGNPPCCIITADQLLKIYWMQEALVYPFIEGLCGNTRWVYSEKWSFCASMCGCRYASRHVGDEDAAVGWNIWNCRNKPVQLEEPSEQNLRNGFMPALDQVKELSPCRDVAIFGSWIDSKREWGGSVNRYMYSNSQSKKHIFGSIRLAQLTLGEDKESLPIVSYSFWDDWWFEWGSGNLWTQLYNCPL